MTSLVLVSALHIGCGSTETNAAMPPPATTTSATSTPVAVPEASAAPTNVAPNDSTPPIAAPAPAVLEYVNAYPVGKWPEGIALSGGDAFVAESGDRKVARVDLATGKVKARIDVGRLPVNLITGADGLVYALVHTDQSVLAIDPATNRTRVVARLPDAPQAMTLVDGMLWVLLGHKQSSADSTVVRIDPKTGKHSRSELLGKNAWNIAANGDNVWVLHDERISVLDAKTLAKQPDIVFAGFHRSLVFAAGAFYADVGTSIVRIDAATKEATNRADMLEPVALLAAVGNDIVGAGRKGNVWRLDGVNLALKAEFLPKEQFVPQFIVPNGDSFLVTEHGSHDAQPDHGSLIVLRPH